MGKLDTRMADKLASKESANKIISYVIQRLNERNYYRGLLNGTEKND